MMRSIIITGVCWRRSSSTAAPVGRVVDDGLPTVGMRARYASTQSNVALTVSSPPSSRRWHIPSCSSSRERAALHLAACDAREQPVVGALGFPRPPPRSSARSTGRAAWRTAARSVDGSACGPNGVVPPPQEHRQVRHRQAHEREEHTRRQRRGELLVNVAFALVDEIVDELVDAGRLGSSAAFAWVRTRGRASGGTWRARAGRPGAG